MLNAEWDHPDVFEDEEAVLDAFEAWLLSPGADAAHGRRQRRRPGSGRRRGPSRWAMCTRSSGSGDADRQALAGTIALPGAHNVSNAACVAAAARALGVAEADIVRGLSTFHGVGRRLELKADVMGVTVYDDYGHHPTAIAATMAAVRERHPGRRLIAVYEPLTFHRTAAMLEQFADVLANADEARIADIWAGRDPDTNVTSPLALAAAINRRGRAPATPTGSPRGDRRFRCSATVRAGDVVLVMGGGRSYVIADRLAKGCDGWWRPRTARLNVHADTHARGRAGPACRLQGRLGTARSRRRTRAVCRQVPSIAMTRSMIRSWGATPSASCGTRAPASQTNVEFDAERVWTSAAWVLSSYHAAYTDRANARPDPPPRLPGLRARR